MSGAVVEIHLTLNFIHLTLNSSVCLLHLYDKTFPLKTIDYAKIVCPFGYEMLRSNRPLRAASG
jgi:hypothetical protein